MQLRDGRLPFPQRPLAALKLGILSPQARGSGRELLLRLVAAPTLVRQLLLRPLAALTLVRQRCALRLRVHVHLGVGSLHLRAPRPLYRQLPFKRPPSLPLALQLVLHVCEWILNLRQCSLY